MNLVFLLIFAFLLGSLPTAYWVVKYVKKIDIRQYGSGNVGATNAARVLGRGYGLVVLIIDFLKGLLPTLLALKWAGPYDAHWIGLAAILGHIFTPFLGFKGGKGIATGSGVLSIVFPPLFGICFIVWLLFFLLTKIASISSIIAVTSGLIVALILKYSMSAVCFLSVVFLLVLWTHRTNISRLISGKESRSG
jgi:glycerol-3-phosphate acyltransferase PlsY